MESEIRQGPVHSGAGGNGGRPERRTFAIISHPDAGKTTLTEKFLLYAGAIKMAGAVKSRKQQSVRSDWLEMERQRGISITSTVLGLDYRGYRLNLLDTPGHADFSEDTYRTLYAVDAALMVLDAARGIEERTLKLFEVCRQQGIPIITFVNKLDRPSLEPLELLDQVESALKLRAIPVTWPVGSAQDFQGVVDRRSRALIHYDRTAHGSLVGSEEVLPLSAVEGDGREAIFEELELLEAIGSGVGTDFDREAFLTGELTPVFFGSALANFGVRLLLDSFVDLAPAPTPRRDSNGEKRELDEPFSGFVFKVQANMDPRHRDRVAFVRVCSGRFERGMRLVHEPTGQIIATRHAQQLFAEDRSTLETAFPGDVVGLVNASELNIGDTLYDEAAGSSAAAFPTMPEFVPEHFVLARNRDARKHKQFWKGLKQLSQEGVVKILKRFDDGGQEPILGAVGPLQFQVAEYRMEHEFGAPITVRAAPWTEAIKLEVSEVDPMLGTRGARVVHDDRGEPFALFGSRYLLDQALQLLPREAEYPTV